MKKKFLSILLGLCMVMALLPTTAFATGTAPELIKVGGIELTDGKYLAANDAPTASTYTGSDSYVALYKDGVLYLNGLNITRDTQCIWWQYDSSGKHNLIVELAEGSTNTLVRTNGAAINGESGWSSGGPCLTVRGNGTLNVTGSSYGIWVWEDVIIEDGAVVNATGTSNAGISNNNTNGVIVVKQGASLTTVGGEYGVESDNGYNGALSVLGGSFTAIGGTAALEVPADFSGNTVYVGNSVSDAQEWDGSTALTSYKYISLSGFSSDVNVYDVTTSTTSNGSFAVDYAESMADETVTITARPDSGYEVDTVTVTGTDDSPVTVSGTGDTRTFTMPEDDVTVSVTFKPTTYTITYHLNGGTNASGNPATYKVVTDSITLADPSKDGYTFGGWFENSGFTGNAVTTIAQGSTGNKEYYAKWVLNLPETLEDVTFGFAYDVQRDPAYPTKGGDITFYDLSAPIGPDGSSSGQTNAGSWTLTRAGTYFYLDSTSTISDSLKRIANTIADKYSEAGATEAEKTAFKNSLVIHELKKGDVHYAYGVVVAYNVNSGYAAFIGDSLSGSAGYLLSVNELTGSVTTTADMVATDFVPSLSITLSTSGTHTFDGKNAGYTESDLSSLEVTVTNTGNDATGALAVTLTGDNASSFSLGDVDNNFKSGIALRGTDTFTVQPKTGLSAGTHTATVTVSGANIVSQSFDVSFTVNPAGGGGGGGGGGYTPATYSVTVDKADNGSVSASPKSASKGTTITVTVDPDKGYTLETLTVTDKNGDEIELTNKGDGKYTFNMPASKVYVEATFMEDNSMLNFFVDVFPGDYYYDAVLWAAENGITGGVDDTHFAPNGICTRAQAVTFLWRAAGCPAPKSSEMPFKDVVKGSYYYDAVLWAVENGITKGTGDTTFSPNATCSRAQIVSFLYRAASSLAVSGSAVFTDVSAGSYYASAVAWAVENGITGGTGNNAFSPNADCTRAQIVTFLYRWMVK